MNDSLKNRKVATIRALVLAAMLLLCAPFVCAQTDSFSIRVDSNLVLIHTEVVDKRFRHKGASVYYDQCERNNIGKFSKLSPSEPYLPADCGDWMIHNLRATDFHVFEDGIEQKVESLKAEPRVEMTARDNSLGLHNTWATSPRGIWSTADVRFNPGNMLSTYRVGYVPSKKKLGECHRIEVKVDNPNAVVFSPHQFCYVEHPATDPLKGTELGNQMEVDLGSNERPRIPLSAQAQVLYTNAQMARVDIVLEFPWEWLDHEWIDGDLNASVGVLGVVYTKNGTAVGRFSDLAYGGVPYGPHIGAILGVTTYELNDPGYLPSRYETQIELPVGEYELRVILSDGKRFGRTAIPLGIDGYKSGNLGLSSVILIGRFRNAKAAAAEATAVNLAPEYVPLVSQDTVVTPAAESTLKRTKVLPVYFEIYDDSLPENSPGSKVQAHLKIVDARTGEVKREFPLFDAAPYRRPGSNAFAVIKALKVDQLPKGEYRLEVEAADDAGRSTGWKITKFALK